MSQPHLTTARLQVKTNSLKREFYATGFAGRTPNELNFLLSNLSGLSLILQKESAPAFASYARSSLVLQSTESVLKNSEGLLVLGLNQTTVHDQCVANNRRDQTRTGVQ